MTSFDNAGLQEKHDAGSQRSNEAEPPLDDAVACPQRVSGSALFQVIDRDANNNNWLYGVSYEGPAKVDGFIDTRRIITFDDPAMMGRQLEIDGASDVVRGLQAAQTLWVVLLGWKGGFAPSLTYQVFRESEHGPILFALYGVDPATQPATAPDDRDLLGFTLSIRDGCSVRVPDDMACFEDTVRTELLVTAHADADIELEPGRLAQIEIDGDAYDLSLSSADRAVGGQGRCSDAVQGTFLGFQMIAAQ